MKMTGAERSAENDLLIGYLAEALEIVKAKCSRWESRMCMGCCFDSLARGMIPDNIERAIELMQVIPSSKSDVIAAARKSVAERVTKWNEMCQ